MRSHSQSPVPTATQWENHRCLRVARSRDGAAILTSSMTPAPAMTIGHKPRLGYASRQGHSSPRWHRRGPSIRPNVDEESPRKRPACPRQCPYASLAMKLAGTHKAGKVSSPPRRSSVCRLRNQMPSPENEAFEQAPGLTLRLRAIICATRPARRHTRWKQPIVVCETGVPVWRHLARPTPHDCGRSARILSNPMCTAWRTCLLSTVGAYHLRSRAQLFNEDEGDYFSYLPFCRCLRCSINFVRGGDRGHTGLYGGHRDPMPIPSLARSYTMSGCENTG